MLATLRRHLGGLGGEAHRHARRAEERLESAARRDWVFDRDRREADLEAAVAELWMARAEYLREVID